MKMWCDRVIHQSQYVALCLSEESFRRVLRTLKCPKEKWPPFTLSDATTHFLECSGGRVAVVCMIGWRVRRRLEVYGLLIHEAVHIWKDELRHRREDEPGEEMECYGIQAISQNLIHAFEKQTKR